MRIEVLLFSQEARLAGRQRLQVEVATPTAEAVKSALAQAESSLADCLPHCRIAVNQEYASPGQMIQPGDEVAIIGPVSGG